MSRKTATCAFIATALMLTVTCLRGRVAKFVPLTKRAQFERLGFVFTPLSLARIALTPDEAPVVQQLIFDSCSEHRQLAGCLPGST